MNCWSASSETGNGGDNKADDTVSIDVSGAKSEVTSVELSSTSLETLVKVTIHSRFKARQIEQGFFSALGERLNLVILTS